jgi:hypothetical protein
LFQKKLERNDFLSFSLPLFPDHRSSFFRPKKERRKPSLRLSDGERGVEGLLLVLVHQRLASLKEHRRDRACEDRERELGRDLFCFEREGKKERKKRKK